MLMDWSAKVVQSRTRLTSGHVPILAPKSANVIYRSTITAYVRSISFTEVKSYISNYLSFYYLSMVQSLRCQLPNNTVKMDAEVYFRFMDLPVELRLMIYENLTFTTHQHPIKTPDDPSTESSGDKHSDVIGAYGTVTKKCFPVAVLGVCKKINLEAKAIVLEKLQQLSHESIRLFMDMGAFAECMDTETTGIMLLNALCLSKRPKGPGNAFG